MLKEQIFDKMNGFLAEGLLSLPEQCAIEDEFAEGKECCLLYEGIYQAERNLCERFGEDENEDVETILNGMEKITRILAMKMYEYITSRNLQPLFHGAFRTYFSKITHFFLKNT